MAPKFLQKAWVCKLEHVSRDDEQQDWESDAPAKDTIVSFYDTLVAGLLPGTSLHYEEA